MDEFIVAVFRVYGGLCVSRRGYFLVSTVLFHATVQCFKSFLQFQPILFHQCPGIKNSKKMSLIYMNTSDSPIVPHSKVKLNRYTAGLLKLGSTGVIFKGTTSHSHFGGTAQMERIDVQLIPLAIIYPFISFISGFVQSFDCMYLAKAYWSYII